MLKESEIATKLLNLLSKANQLTEEKLQTEKLKQDLLKEQIFNARKDS